MLSGITNYNFWIYPEALRNLMFQTFRLHKDFGFQVIACGNTQQTSEIRPLVNSYFPSNQPSHRQSGSLYDYKLFSQYMPHCFIYIYKLHILILTCFLTYYKIHWRGQIRQQARVIGKDWISFPASAGIFAVRHHAQTRPWPAQLPVRRGKEGYFNGIEAAEAKLTGHSASVPCRCFVHLYWVCLIRLVTYY